MLDWERKTAKYTNGIVCSLGDTIVGSVDWDPVGHPDGKYKITTLLAGYKTTQGNCRTEDGAKERMGHIVTTWLRKTGLHVVDPRYQECVDKGYKFFSDISSQLGEVVIQDYQNMNEFAILLSQLCEES